MKNLDYYKLQTLLKAQARAKYGQNLQGRSLLDMADYHCMALAANPETRIHLGPKEI